METVYLCVHVCTWGWGKERQDALLYVRGKNEPLPHTQFNQRAGLLGHRVSLFSSKPASRSSWDTPMCTDTQHVHTNTHTHTQSTHVANREHLRCCGQCTGNKYSHSEKSELVQAVCGVRTLSSVSMLTAESNTTLIWQISNLQLRGDRYRKTALKTCLKANSLLCRLCG